MELIKFHDNKSKNSKSSLSKIKQIIIIKITLTLKIFKILSIKLNLQIKLEDRHLSSKWILKIHLKLVPKSSVFLAGRIPKIKLTFNNTLKIIQMKIKSLKFHIFQPIYRTHLI